MKYDRNKAINELMNIDPDATINKYKGIDWIEVETVVPAHSFSLLNSSGG